MKKLTYHVSTARLSCLTHLTAQIANERGGLTFIMICRYKDTKTYMERLNIPDVTGLLLDA